MQVVPIGRSWIRCHHLSTLVGEQPSERLDSLSPRRTIDGAVRTSSPACPISLTECRR